MSLSSKLGRIATDLRAIRGGNGSLATYLSTLVNYGIYKADFFRLPHALHNPLFLQIEPTSRCNLRCPMCMRDKVDAPRGDMTFEHFKQIVSQCHNLYRIHLQGNGEPFLHRQLIEFVEYARHRGICVTLITNGTLIGDALAPEILRSGLNEIQFSVDSLDKAEYEAIRIGATLEKVRENIMRLTRARDAAKSPLEVSLTVVIQSSNLGEIPDFISFASEAGIGKVSFQYLEVKHQPRYAPGFFEDHSPFGNAERLSATVLSTKQLAAEKGIVCDFVSERTSGCLWPWEGLYITWDGRVTPCCLIFDHFVGNAFEQNILEIWNNKAMREFRRRLRSSNVPAQCKGCCHLQR